jgi:hypothetical protein
MDVTCAARECSVTTVLTSGGTFIQTLAPGQSTLVQTSARITISFARR